MKRTMRSKTGRPSPVIIHVPHASTVIPEEERDCFVTDDLEGEILRMTDHCCDDLFECGHDMIAFPYSRLVCDVERFRDDSRETMAGLGMGFAYTHGSDLRRIRELTPEHKRHRIERGLYDPHHEELERMVERKLREYGRCLIIDAHSFPAEPLPYERYMAGDRGEGGGSEVRPGTHGGDRSDARGGADRPDICIGTDDYHTGAELREKTVTFFEERGYRVAVNDPFAGALVPERFYRKDPRVQSIMIEVNRKLYMDADARKTDGYAGIKRDLGEYLAGLDDLFQRRDHSMDFPSANA